MEKKILLINFSIFRKLIKFLYLTVAIQALKRKKRYELQLNQIDGTLTTLEYQREALENANTNTEVLKTMGEATLVIKDCHSKINVDQLQDLKDDIAEHQYIANEIANVISTPVGHDAFCDDDELLKELEELEQERRNRAHDFKVFLIILLVSCCSTKCFSF